ncbi:MAG: polysaccharide deacetylase family protein [Sulfuricurvum sp.]|nr:polysaccharide deacetylase family protein [Sulfuricurvum sp.]
MMKKLVLLFFLCFQTLLCAHVNVIYDIHGQSPLLDANLTHFLDKWRTDTVSPIQEGIYKNVVVNGDPTRKNIALTFDDSPDENNTIKLLNILDTHHVKAAFFMIGGTMRDGNISVVKQTHNEGHLVLSHSFNHPRFTDLNETAIIEQLDKAAGRIEAITQNYPLLFRPPYGSINQNVLNTINEHNVTTVLWSLDSLDWTLKDPDAVIQNVVSNVRNGDIILMHRNPTSVASLAKIIEILQSQGYTIDRLDTLLGIHPYR